MLSKRQRGLTDRYERRAVVMLLPPALVAFALIYAFLGSEAAAVAAAVLAGLGLPTRRTLAARMRGRGPDSN